MAPMTTIRPTQPRPGVPAAPTRAPERRATPARPRAGDALELSVATSASMTAAFRGSDVPRCAVLGLVAGGLLAFPLLLAGFPAAAFRFASGFTLAGAAFGALSEAIKWVQKGS